MVTRPPSRLGYLLGGTIALAVAVIVLALAVGAARWALGL